MKVNHIANLAQKIAMISKNSLLGSRQTAEAVCDLTLKSIDVKKMLESRFKKVS